MSGTKRPAEDSEQREPKRVRSNYSDIITLLVGPTQDKFYVHRDLICNKSAFFKAAISSEWQEAESKAVSLPEHQPAVFKIYLETLYGAGTTILELAKSHASEIVTDAEGDFSDHLHDWTLAGRGHRVQTAYAMIKLYIMGDYLGDIDLKNEVMEAIVDGHNERSLQCGKESARLLFKSTPEDCGLQKFIADMTIPLLKGPAEVDQCNERYGANFLSAVLKAMIEKRCGDIIPGKIEATKYLE